MGLLDKIKNKNLQEKKKDIPLVSGSPGLGGEQEKFRKKNERQISKDMEKSINKRLSADLTRGDQARSQYGTDGGYGDSNVGDATVNKFNCLEVLIVVAPLFGVCVPVVSPFFTFFPFNEPDAV